MIKRRRILMIVMERIRVNTKINSLGKFAMIAYSVEIERLGRRN